MTTQIAPSVLADWGEWSARFEGRESGMYRDDTAQGWVTTGIGCLVDPVALALPLPWLRADGTAASPDDIAAEWRRVKAMPKGMLASHYRASTGLHLSDDAIDALARERLQANANVLAHYYHDFATFPPQAQRGILSMAWAMGAGFPQTWPLFSAAVRAQDWASAAANCWIPNANDNRNEANRSLFMAAANVGNAGDG